MSSIGDLKQFLKDNFFSNYHVLKKNELEKLVNDFKKTNKVPRKYRKKLTIGQPCKRSYECFTEKCLDNECVTNPDKKKNLALLPKKTELNLKNSDKNTDQCTKYKNIKLKEHQEFIVNFMKDTERKGILLHHNVGSGKTLTSITIGKCLLSKYPTKRVIILTPTSVKNQFEKEVEKTGMSKELLSRFNVYSHTMWLDRFKEKVETSRDAILIVDEAHKFKTLYKKTKKKTFGKKAYLLSKAALKAFKIILLTATPLENNIKEIQNYVAMINNMSLKEEYEKSKRRFEDVKDKNILEKDYRKYLKCKFSYFKNNNKDDYPDRREYFIKLKMTEKYQNKYDIVEQEMLDNMNILKLFTDKKEDQINLKTFFNGTRRAINKIKVKSPKLKWTIDKIKEHVNNNEKILVYSTWVEYGMDILEKDLKKNNTKYGVIKGDIKASERQKIVDQYNLNEIKVLLITCAGCEGLDLKETRSIVIVEPYWNKSKIEQIIGRGVRYKSHELLPKEEQYVNIYNLILQKKNMTNETPSIDDIMFDMATNKQTIIEQFTNQIRDASVEKNKC